MTIQEIYKLFLNNKSVCTDTRKITPGCIFFALKGTNFNGNKFAESALNSGASYAVIDEPTYKLSDRYILVSNALETLQQLSNYHRKQFNIPVIAIVGSNGKTTTKELITSVLSQNKNVLSTPGNFNNHIGLPLTLLMLNQQHNIAVIEMGANHVGENEFLCKLAEPTHGLITNNGKDHLEGFGSLEGVANSNSELYYYLLNHNGLAFVNANDEWLMRMANRLTQKITYAANDSIRNISADIVARAIQLQPEIKFIYKGLTINSVLSGDYNFDNVMAAVAIGHQFNLSAEQIKQGIELYKPANLRSQVVNTLLNKIYLDAYNANPSSMEVSIKNFAQMPYSNKVLILGDMFELGDYAKQEHANIVSLCKQLNFKNVLLAGLAFYDTDCNYLKFKTTADLKNYLTENKLSGNCIFIKGSRSMKLESLLELL